MPSRVAEVPSQVRAVRTSKDGVRSGRNLRLNPKLLIDNKNQSESLKNTHPEYPYTLAASNRRLLK